VNVPTRNAYLISLFKSTGAKPTTYPPRTSHIGVLYVVKMYYSP
jgi:hypothetical protein